MISPFMSGIYFHIPFCKTKCNYCDFYKSTNISLVQPLIQAIKDEITLRKDFIEDKNIQTIYFGGGTPSLLNCVDIEELITAVFHFFVFEEPLEITLEANPDDLTLGYLRSLKKTRINRLSIGIQSFSDKNLKFMGRRHNSDQAINAVKNAQQIGFDNISVDLIYGIPGLTFQQWHDNLKTVFDLNIQHLSAYHLTYHEGTFFYNQLQRGLIHEVEEEESILQFEELMKAAEDNNFIHYEISNFAREGFYSRHNSSYWKQVEYLGLGPSAHSYNKKSRYWNVSDLSAYIEAISQKKIAGGSEQLTINDRFNDYIITGLRTTNGIDSVYIEKEFGKKYSDAVEQLTQKNLLNGKVRKEENRIKIEKKSLLISDQIISDYLYLENEGK
jgi:oxygen-independent coproporphyrinogen III oxidase